MHLDGWTWEEMAVKRGAMLDMLFPQIQTVPAQFAAAAGAPVRTFAEEEKQYKIELRAPTRVLRGSATLSESEGRRSSRFPSGHPPGSNDPGNRRQNASDDSSRTRTDDQGRGRICRQGKGQSHHCGPERDWLPPAPLLKEKNIPVVLSDTLTLPMRDDDPYDAPYTLPNEFYKAGMKFCFGSFDVQFARNVPFQAAQASAFGLPREEALKAITINSAEILGVGDQIGSIDKGKFGDLILTDGDPLEAKTNIKRMFIAGREVPLSSRHTREYEKWMSRP